MISSLSKSLVNDSIGKMKGPCRAVSIAAGIIQTPDYGANEGFADYVGHGPTSRR
jgi:hypothetical protein